MPGEDPTESLITQALFGDASVSMLMGSAPDGVGIQILRTHTEQLYDQHTMMSLRTPGTARQPQCYGCSKTSCN